MSKLSELNICPHCERRGRCLECMSHPRGVGCFDYRRDHNAFYWAVVDGRETADATEEVCRQDDPAWPVKSGAEVVGEIADIKRKLGEKRRLGFEMFKMWRG